MLKTEISPAVSAIADHLAGLSIYETATYPVLSALIAKDIQQHRWIIASARKVAARDHGVVVSNQKEVGYVRIPANTLPDLGSMARTHIRRTSRRAARVIRWGSERANDLRPDAQRRINAELSTLGLLEHLARDNIAKPAPIHDVGPETVAAIGRRLLDRGAL